ncbi:MAG TPA: helix-hairpin-helix domain-containing protein [Saprospiraceae bacterium]|nr:helix-hairpin-helix domain-containing protein [Saprospiraceae bacterium]
MKNRYSKEDRTALYITTLLILCFIGTKWINNITAPRPIEFPVLQEKTLLSKMSASANVYTEEMERKQPNFKETKAANKFFSFDPNTLPKDSLLLLPIDKKVVYNLIKYREKGGRFHSPKDLMKIYGMESYEKSITNYAKFEGKVREEIFEKTSENVGKGHLESLPTPIEANSYSIPSIAESIKKDTFSSHPTIYTESKKEHKIFEKDSNGSVAKKSLVDINSADQYQMMMINGVGAFYSKLLVEYRDRIGGFYSKDQLLQIKGIQADRVYDWFDQIHIDESKIRKLKVNEASFKQLAALPNIGYKKAEILKLYIENNGSMKDISQLLKVGVFNAKDVEVLTHYLSFD